MADRQFGLLHLPQIRSFQDGEVELVSYSCGCFDFWSVGGFWVCFFVWLLRKQARIIGHSRRSNLLFVDWVWWWMENWNNSEEDFTFVEEPIRRKFFKKTEIYNSFFVFVELSREANRVCRQISPFAFILANFLSFWGGWFVVVFMLFSYLVVWIEGI